MNLLEGKGVFSVWMDEAACRGQEALFDAAALEWDPRASTARALTPHEQAVEQKAYDDAVAACQNVCNTCPVLNECRDWVQSHPLRVYGVVGGLAPEDRTVPADAVTRTQRDLVVGPINAQLVLALHSQGLSVPVISRQLRRPERSIRRVLAQRTLGQVGHTQDATTPRYSALSIPENHTTSEHLLVDVPRHVISVPHPRHPDSFPVMPDNAHMPSLPTVKQPFNPRGASGIAAAVLDVLADGKPHSRDELIAAAVAVIPDDLALREWAVGVSAATETPAVRVMRATATQVPHATRVARGATRRASSYLAWMERTRGWVHRRSGGYIAAREALFLWHAHRASHVNLMREQVPA